MTVGLYGYETWEEFTREEIPVERPTKLITKPGYNSEDVSLGDILATAMVKPPEPPKPKEFNKKLISTELKKSEESINKVYQQSVLLLDQMVQEDADDVYGITQIVKDFHSFFKEWAKTRECLNKELELSLPISKLMV